MSNWGRIATDLWRHDKATRCSDAAIGVWTRANSWSRDHRTAGFISYQDAEQWNQDSIQELVDSGLWDQVDGGFMYHNYPKHNGDIGSKTVSVRMVHDLLGGKFPDAVIASLANKVDELLIEGQEPRVLKEAIKVWSETPKAGVGLLPFLVADILRKNQENDILQVIRECWKSHDVTPLRKFGYWFRAPSAPEQIQTAPEMRDYMRERQREWLKDLADQIGSTTSSQRSA